MESYRYQQLAYLIIPILVGMEFFLTAKTEKQGSEEAPFGSYVLDFFGFVFIALIPAVFIFTIWAVETKRFMVSVETLARFDRYAVMFLFMGSWWQVYILSALRARRLRKSQVSDWYVWVPYIVLGIYGSALVLWAAPWGLMWFSLLWVLMTFGVLKFFKVSAKNIERIFWVMALIMFLMENILFIFLESVM